MLARIAHELFWLGRNLVRAEHTARMLDGVFQADLQGRPDDPSEVTLTWGSLLMVMGVPVEDPARARRDEVLGRLTLDPNEPSSIVACVARAREAARTVRDVISAEMWEAINTTNLTFAADDVSARMRTGPYSFLRDVKARSALFWGLTSRTMLRDDASAFLTAGGRMEGADMVLRMLRVAVPPGTREREGEGDVIRDGQALALLHAVGGLQAFRRAGPAAPNALPVLRFLLYERAFPDSVAASVDATLAVLQRADAQPRTSEPLLRLGRLVADLEFRAREETDAATLSRRCETVQQELTLVDRDIAERYFAGALAPDPGVIFA